MNNDEKDPSKSRSVLAKIGGWLSPKKEEGPRAAGDTQAAPSPREQQTMAEKPRPAQPAARPVSSAGPAAPLPADGATSVAETTPGATPPRTGRKRPPRKRSARKPKPAGSMAEPAEAEAVEPLEQAADEPVKTSSQVKLLINSDEPEECRIALVEDGRVESFHVETVVHAQTKGNIYKGIITAVEPNLQAAFVDLGIEKNGFLSFGDIHPEYYFREVDPELNWKQLSIDKVVRKGQEILVEVVKEATGNKGASLTSFLSLPGRYLVLMPGSDSAGISRKIESDAQRTRLRTVIESFNLPEGIGYIVRTASKDITKTALSQDMEYLLNLWDEIKAKGQQAKAPALIYKEQNIISRFLRDHFTSDIQEILVDDQEAFAQVQRFLELLPASQNKTRARLYQGSRPLFSSNEVEKQIDQIYQPTVQLPSGGSIVINPTEALVAIDVNSGRTAKDKNFEETIFLANMEAAEEAARQLRLRDLGGLIVIDFIDMRESKHIREVEKKVKTSMKRDKAKVDISRISKFGLMQISRQKMASPIQTGNYMVCEHCKGRGTVRSVETMALAYQRRIQAGVIRKNVSRVECRLPLKVAQYLLNRKRAELMEMEKRYNVTIAINPDPTMNPTDEDIQFIKG